MDTLTLTQDEVVLRQLCISYLFVQSAARVHINVSHEAAFVKFPPDLPSKPEKNTQQLNTVESG